MRVRKLEQNRGWAMAVAAGILKPTLLAATSRTLIDGEKIPATGGCIVVLNHISHVDPLLSAHFVYDHGRLPRYLAKSGLFTNKYLGGFLSSAGQIPVERLSRNAIGAYDAAVKAIAEGAKSCKSLLALARREGVDAPIAEAVDAVVDGKMTAHDMMNSFIARDTKSEMD